MRLVNEFEIPDICYGTDIVSHRWFDDNFLKRVIKRIYCRIGYLLGKYPRYKKETGIIKCTNNAFNFGVRFYDTSRAYEGSERMIRYALKGKNRKDYFVCTKLMNQDQIKGVSARDALMQSMKELGVDYVDVYLLHWPVEGKFLDYWKQLEELYEEGLVKAIGVSNCKVHHLEEIKKICKIMPMINEVELHPLLTEKQLIEYCNKNNIVIMAYTSTARLDFRLKNSRRMQSICRETGKSLSQVILRWHIQNGIVPIFNTSSIKHLKDNMAIFDFELNNDQMKLIDSMNINSRTRYDSDNCEWDRL